jgi:hypothetical protein
MGNFAAAQNSRQYEIRVLACFNPLWPNLNLAAACFELFTLERTAERRRNKIGAIKPYGLGIRKAGGESCNAVEPFPTHSKIGLQPRRPVLKSS